MSRDETSAIKAARDEHLALAIPGWGAPAPRFRHAVKLSVVEAAANERRDIEAALRRECDATLRAITTRDVVVKFGTTYSRARAAFGRVRRERGLPLPARPKKGAAA